MVVAWKDSSQNKGKHHKIQMVIVSKTFQDILLGEVPLDARGKTAHPRNLTAHQILDGVLEACALAAGLVLAPVTRDASLAAVRNRATFSAEAVPRILAARVAPCSAGVVFLHTC